MIGNVGFEEPNAGDAENHDERAAGQRYQPRTAHKPAKLIEFAGFSVDRLQANGRDGETEMREPAED